MSEMQGGPSGAAEMMTAIVQDGYGDDAEDVLRLDRVDRPSIGPGDVLVRVHAASVDRGTWHIMAGLPYPIRVAGFGLRRPKALNPGRSFAGTVESVGVDVTGVAAGEEVYGTCEGSFAEYARVGPARLARKPENLTFGQAAAVPISGLTALQAVRDRGRVEPGQQVLILGGAGGVGSFAVQIAKAFGGEVTGVCGPTKVVAVRAMGADHVLDYTREEITDGGRRYDVILDTGGNRTLSTLRRALTPEGTLVIVGGETGGRWLDGLDRQLRAHLLSLFVRQKLGTFISSENAADLDGLRDLIESGAVAPVIDHTYPLADTAAAIRHLVDGRARGKIVIDVGH